MTDDPGDTARPSPRPDVPAFDFSRKVATSEEGGQALVQKIKDLSREVRRGLE